MFSTPCEAFAEEAFTKTKEHQDKLASWCTLRYHNDILSPLFRVAKDLRGRRGKRQLAAVGVVSAVVGVGYAVTNIYDNKQHIAVLEDSVANMRAMVASSQDHIKALAMTVKERDEMLQQHQKFFKNFPSMSTAIADASSKISTQALLVRQIVRAFKKGKIDPAFFDLFDAKNVTAGALMDNIIAIDAWKDEKEGYLEIHYQLAYAHPTAKLNQADPFIMIANKTIGDEEKQCEFVYAGPRFAVVTPFCSFPLAIDEQQVETTAFAFSEQTCRTVTDEEQDSFWRQTRCGSPFLMPAQLKYTIEFTYIYCPGWEIQLYKDNLSCPNHVFKLSSRDSFRIGDMDYNGNSKIISQRNVSLLDNILILTHLYPRALEDSVAFEHDPDDIIKAIDKDKSTLMQTLFPRSPSMWAVVPTTVLFSIILYHMYRCYSNRRRPASRRHHDDSADAAEAIPMRALVVAKPRNLSGFE